MSSARIVESARESDFASAIEWPPGPSSRAVSACSAAPNEQPLPTGPVIGFDLPGCFSELAVLPEIALVKVDDRISDSEAACLQSLSDSVAAVETAQLRMGDTS